ncbi:hypothetical protein CTEN210_15658 [Chaetoceros tenuissimus]|uniref:Uncharacterized protein n=1 Tax=Chaetoceros tenuissimus TaxID=426638 RepID=A0AAD3D847_9STRA|nr:hypothetical protein CTEN210_15658 [Chaetoceros tenuissimus]
MSFCNPDQMAFCNPEGFLGGMDEIMKEVRNELDEGLQVNGKESTLKDRFVNTAEIAADVANFAVDGSHQTGKMFRSASVAIRNPKITFEMSKRGFLSQRTLTANEEDSREVPEGVKGVGIYSRDLDHEEDSGIDEELEEELEGEKIEDKDEDDEEEEEEDLKVVEKRTEFGDEVVDYSEKTTLYKFAEKRNWSAVLDVLDSRPKEAKTYVQRFHVKDPTKLAWRMLPMHAICYPEVKKGDDGEAIQDGIRGSYDVIKKFIEVYPEGLQKKDDQGMLPFHHAARNCADPAIIDLMYHAYTESLAVQDNKGRTPIKLAQKSRAINKKKILAHLINLKIRENDKNLEEASI